MSDERTCSNPTIYAVGNWHMDCGYSCKFCDWADWGYESHVGFYKCDSVCPKCGCCSPVRVSRVCREVRIEHPEKSWYRPWTWFGTEIVEVWDRDIHYRPEVTNER